MTERRSALLRRLHILSSKIEGGVVRFDMVFFGNEPDLTVYMDSDMAEAAIGGLRKAVARIKDQA